MINTVHTTAVMEPSKRADGFYPRRCQYNRCSLPAWYSQHAKRSDGAETMRVVCKRTFNDKALDFSGELK